MALPTIITPCSPATTGAGPKNAKLGGADGALAAATAADGDRFVNDGSQRLIVANASDDDVTVTITSQATVTDDLTLEDPSFTVPAHTTRVWKELKPATYNDEGGYVSFVCAPAVDVTVGVID